MMGGATPPTILAELKAKIKIENLRILAGIGLKRTITLGTWQSGPSPGTPRAKNKKIKIILSTARPYGYRSPAFTSLGRC